MSNFWEKLTQGGYFKSKNEKGQSPWNSASSN